MSDTTDTNTDTTNTNTNTDEPSKAELHERVQQLESTVAKMMPSRRDALRMGAVGIAGAAGLGAATQPADASTGSAGTIGSTSDRPDLLADDVGPRSIASDYLYAGEFSGSDPDARLDNAIADASGGDVIYLENDSYNDSIAIPKTVALKGIGGLGFDPPGTFLSTGATWTLQGRGASVSGINLNGSSATLIADADEIRFTHIVGTENTDIEIRTDGCIVSVCREVEVTLTSSSSNCIVDTISELTVTDNGSNNVIGDVT
jgi:hypothetical protein